MKKDRLEHLDVIVTPQEAMDRLRNLGIPDQGLDSLLEDKNDFGNHELKSLARISRGTSPKNLRDIYISERKKDYG